MSFSDSDFDDFDPAGLDELEQIEIAYATGAALPPKSIVSRPGLQQRDLFGGTVAEKEKKAAAAGPSRAGSGGGAGRGGGQQETAAKVRLTKRWDPASFAKHGWSKKKATAKKAMAKGKGKGRAYASDEEAWDDEEIIDDDEDDDEIDETLLDPSYDPNAPLLPIKWKPDPEASKTWLYPVQADKPLRTYQYNIVHRALFADTLVSLPTGLGKTFIAACVMLNFYRWYPQGKIIFLAPTRPLVTQQIKACHYIAGIPQSDCIELTGQTAPKLRTIAWATKRVIYCTPQTVENDLAKGRLDPRDVTCLVVDEAHRASGDYAYCGVVRFMMSRNQHFRVLALTATPGAKGEAVQEVIDSLHIGKIEVRTDESFDITPYVHKKHFDLTVIPLGPQLSSLRDRWGALMKTYMGPLLAARLIFEGDPTAIGPYAVNMANGRIQSLPGGGKANGKYYPMIKTLGPMARAMEYLVIQSLSSFETVLKDIASDGAKALVSSPAFRDILRETNVLRATNGYVGHPKMEKLRSMCIEHFVAAEDEVDQDGKKKETRVMVFCNFRAVVDEIVDCLNQQRPLINATAFVGQGTAKGVKGRSQKDQIETIKKFKAGTYNVLVATSIGEEGLDIGEIDLIVCYEANKSPIRMLQRVGRTGRARDGRIIVLMTEGREEKNWDKANDAYTDVQNALISNKIFELYVDGDRMLPKEVKPEVDKVEIKALPLDLTTMTMVGQGKLDRKTTAEEKKEKKKRDAKLNVPNDAFLGFRTAGQIAAAAKAPVSPGKELRDRKRAALLTLEEETLLRERWQFSGNDRLRPAPLDPHNFPFELGNTGSALRIPRHSTRHSELLATLRTIAALDDSNPDALDAWHDKMSDVYDPKLIRPWERSARGPPPHPRIRIPLPSADPPSSYPKPTPSLVAAPRPASIVPIARLPTSSPPPSPPPRAAPNQHRSQTIYHHSDPPAPQARATIDPFNILSSEAEDDPPPVAGPSKVNVVPPRNRPRAYDGPPAVSTNYSMEIDDDIDMSDSELLRGAIVKGKPQVEAKAGAKPMEEITLDSDDDTPPPALPKPARAKSSTSNDSRRAPDAPKKVVEQIDIISDDDDPPPPRPSHLQRPPIDRSRRSPSPLPPPPAPVSRSPSGDLIPDSDNEAEAYLLPPPPPRVPGPAAQQSEDDEFSFFDVPEDELEACFAIPPANIVKRSPPRSSPPHSAPPSSLPLNLDDSVLMPPPRTSALPAKPEFRKRPQHHRIPDSSSSSVAKSAPRRTTSAPALVHSLDASFDASPVIAFRRAGAGKRKAVVESSSPNDGGLVAGPSRFRFAQDGAADSPAEVAEKAKVLNRLRRGRQLVEDDEEEDEDSPVAPPKAKKPKRIKLSEKAAAKSNLFDFEAINSSASGTEASSEAYSAENSDDRNFVASEDNCDGGEDSPGHHQFLRDSLMTQPPAGFGSRAFKTGFSRTGRAPLAQGTPATPNSQDQWSYDSFCVADDEEIEMESSSQV